MSDTSIPALSTRDWFPDRLRDAAVRYAWAATHIPRLNQVIEAFNNLPPWGLEESPDLGVGMARIRIYHEPPREIGLIIGDLVHSLRASLDYATCALVEIEDSSANLRFIQFPFCRPGEGLSSSERKHLGLLEDLALPYIELARQMGDPYLGVLNRASNQDKHRLIVSLLQRQMPFKLVIDREANTADIVPDAERAEVWMRPVADRDVVAVGNMLALRPGFVVEGDEAPYSMAVIDQLFKVTHQSLCLMMKAAELMLVQKGALTPQ